MICWVKDFYVCFSFLLNQIHCFVFTLSLFLTIRNFACFLFCLYFLFFNCLVFCFHQFFYFIVFIIYCQCFYVKHFSQVCLVYEKCFINKVALHNNCYDKRPFTNLPLWLAPFPVRSEQPPKARPHLEAHSYNADFTLTHTLHLKINSKPNQSADWGQHWSLINTSVWFI